MVEDWQRCERLKICRSLTGPTVCESISEVVVIIYSRCGDSGVVFWVWMKDEKLRRAEPHPEGMEAVGILNVFRMRLPKPLLGNVAIFKQFILGRDKIPIASLNI